MKCSHPCARFISIFLSYIPPIHDIKMEETDPSMRKNKQKRLLPNESSDNIVEIIAKNDSENYTNAIHVEGRISKLKNSN